VTRGLLGISIDLLSKDLRVVTVSAALRVNCLRAFKIFVTDLELVAGLSKCLYLIKPIYGTCDVS
jgi:hypothetical protein